MPVPVGLAQPFGRKDLQAGLCLLPSLKAADTDRRAPACAQHVLSKL